MDEGMPECAEKPMHFLERRMGPPIFKVPNGLRISGMLSSDDEKDLEAAFSYAQSIESPVIDMTNFDNMGTILIPIFERFYKRCPTAKWRLNETAVMFLSQVGIENNVGRGGAPDAGSL